MGTIFLKVLVVFMMVGVGFIANKTGVLPEESNKYLVNLLLVITTPCMILGSMAQNRLTDETLLTTVQVLVGSLIFFLAEWLISYLVIRMLRYEPKEDRGVMMCILCGVNTGFMGFPITNTLFGGEFLYYMVIENAVLGVYLYFIAILQMNYGNKTKASPMAALKSFCNMCMLACLIGFILLIGDIRLPKFLLELLDSIGSATVPLSMMVVGVQLGGAHLKKVLTNHKLIFISFCNVLVMPALTFLAVNWLPITWKTKVLLIFAAAFPCAVALSAMAIQEKKNATLMAEGIALTTLLSVVTLPMWAMFLSSYYF